MKKQWMKIMTGVVFTLCALFTPVLINTPAWAAPGICEDGTWGENCADAGKGEQKVKSVASNVIDFLIAIVGLLAVVMVVFAGFKMTTSAGDAGKVKSARLTLVYGIIGLIISIMAYALINFVMKKLGL